MWEIAEAADDSAIALPQSPPPTPTPDAVLEPEEELEDAVPGDPTERMALDAVVKKLRDAPREGYARMKAKKSVASRKHGMANQNESRKTNVIESDSAREAAAAVPTVPLPLSDHKPYVMLSYSWATKEIVKQVHQAIVQMGVNVWIDEAEMRGSLIDRMAEAVEGASAIVLCYSQAYKNSSSCRGEAQYAYKCRKPIIPVRCQEYYDADGWLGFIIGSMLYYDISTPDSFRQNLPGLLKEVARHMDDNDQNNVMADTFTVSTKQPTLQKALLPPPTQLAIGFWGASEEYITWNEQDVQKWLEKEQLTHMKDMYANCFYCNAVLRLLRTVRGNM